jgi:hypothetical protein
LEETTPALGEYVNVYNSALNVISKKGYQLWYDADSDLFGAERGGWDFLADNPISLQIQGRRRRQQLAPAETNL